jgi:L-alanine-DL-glutamate epimerase-like enolase superfamily enzyme
MRVDANQGWNFEDSVKVLTAISEYNIEFCEQPMRYWDDHLLPELRKQSPVKIMADESVYDHRDAERLISANACDYVNIKFAKSGGIHEAIKVHDTCKKHNVPCMMGGMLESRIALSAFAHFATAHPNVIFYDMDTCMLGHKEDPVKGGVKYNGFFIETPSAPGIGADADDDFLKRCETISV